MSNIKNITKFVGSENATIEVLDFSAYNHDLPKGRAKFTVSKDHVSFESDSGGIVRFYESDFIHLSRCEDRISIMSESRDEIDLVMTFKVIN